MADSIELEVPFSSPYRLTKLFVKSGSAFFGIWRPITVKLDGDEEEIIVQRGEEGQLDLFADRVYGDRSLWHVIGHANKIDRPSEQVVPGMRIVIPKLSSVRAALLASTSQQQTNA